MLLYLARAESRQTLHFRLNVTASAKNIRAGFSQFWMIGELVRVKANAAKQVVDPVQVNGDIVRLAISWCDWQLALPKTIRNAAFFRRAVNLATTRFTFAYGGP